VGLGGEKRKGTASIEAILDEGGGKRNESQNFGCPPRNTSQRYLGERKRKKQGGGTGGRDRILHRSRCADDVPMQRGKRWSSPHEGGSCDGGGGGKPKGEGNSISSPSTIWGPSKIEEVGGGTDERKTERNLTSPENRSSNNLRPKDWGEKWAEGGATLEDRSPPQTAVKKG